MKKNILNIGIPSKGRLRKDVLNIFKKNKLNLISERGERDLLGSIKQKKNVKILYLHATNFLLFIVWNIIFIPMITFFWNPI